MIGHKNEQTRRIQERIRNLIEKTESIIKIEREDNNDAFDIVWEKIGNGTIDHMIDEAKDIVNLAYSASGFDATENPCNAPDYVVDLELADTELEMIKKGMKERKYVDVEPVKDFLLDALSRPELTETEENG